MDGGKKSVSVQTALIPVFYKNFHCLAQKCRDNCCVQRWHIFFDKKDYLRLRRLEAPAELRERLAKNVRRLRGEISNDEWYARFDFGENGDRCPFLDQEGLCSLQRACGHEVLPDVCKTYPRRIVYSPAAREYSLSPSCEGVLEQLWKLPEGVEFVEEPLPKSEQRTMKIVQGENLAQYYALIRRVMIHILRNRALTLTERMLYLGITVQRLQKEDWTGFDPDSWGNQTIALMDSDMIKGTLAKITGNRTMYITQNLNVLLEIVKTEKQEDWIGEVFEALEVVEKVALVPDESGEGTQKVHLMDFSLDSYEEALAEFEGAFSGQGYFFENLMVAAALYLDFPSVASREKLWKSYVSLCNLYSFYRFVSVLGCKGGMTKERLFHMIVMASRVILHNRGLFQRFQTELFRHDSSTLAHMAILLNG